MKKVLFILLILAVITKSYSQDYDLIVTTDGDSIACYIDSIGYSYLYFTMKIKNRWIKTQVKKEDLSNYEFKVIDKKRVFFKPDGSSYIKFIMPKEFKNHHTHRYIFGPSAISLAKNNLYISTHWGLVYDIQYGFTDRFSLRSGTDCWFSPTYFIASYTITLNNHSSLAIGDLLLLELSPVGIWSTGSVANMVYGQYTYAKPEFNVSLGGGFLATEDFFEKTMSPTFNISTQIELNKHIYFCTEQYGFQYNQVPEACLVESDIVETFDSKDIAWIGFTGIKYVGRRNCLNSWQLSLLHVLIHPRPIPDKYDQAQWVIHNKTDNTEFLPIPLLTYSRKFGRKH